MVDAKFRLTMQGNMGCAVVMAGSGSDRAQLNINYVRRVIGE